MTSTLTIHAVFTRQRAHAGCEGVPLGPRTHGSGSREGSHLHAGPAGPATASRVPSRAPASAACSANASDSTVGTHDDRHTGRAPYASGCFLPRADLLALGRRHGQARIHGVLFAAAHLPARPVLGQRWRPPGGSRRASAPSRSSP